MSDQSVGVGFGSDDELGPKCLQETIEETVEAFLRTSDAACGQGVLTPQEAIEVACRSSLIAGLRLMIQLMIDEAAEQVEDAIQWHKRCPPMSITYISEDEVDDPPDDRDSIFHNRN